MGRVSGRTFALICAGLLLLGGCGDAAADGAGSADPAWDTRSEEELYEGALKEDVLVVYTVSTRAVETKESFEKEYPGLFVEVRDLRSPNLIDEIESGHANGQQVCDVVICNDNSGEFKSRLVDTGIVVPYLPADIADHMTGAFADGTVSFLNEAELLLYSTAIHDACPVGNIWELTEEKYRGRIYMPNPLRSFSTYTLCGTSLAHADELEEAYRAYAGEVLTTADGLSAAEVFWKRVSENIVFTNSSDEVAEALNDGTADLGWCVSSKLRLAEVGYRLAPVYRLDPFSGCRTSYAVMMSAGSRNKNAAALFIRYLLGGTAGGTGEGIRPFCTAGTWSVRDDIPDGNDVPLSGIDLIIPDQEMLIGQREAIVSFWMDILRGRE
ncbi:MAG: extracellular solute-binding protein [Lachnospiraceae bacterium]|nr:extracellular solute-binding protein [Lachnospiraceae bacterium]